MLSDTVDPAAAVATVGGASDVAVVVSLALVVFHVPSDGSWSGS